MYTRKHGVEKGLKCTQGNIEWRWEYCVHKETKGGDGFKVYTRKHRVEMGVLCKQGSKGSRWV